MRLRTRTLYLLATVISASFLLFTHVLAEDDSSSFEKEFSEKINKSLPILRLEPSDLKLSSGWELPSSIHSIERFFVNPLEVPAQGNNWSARVETAKNASDFFSVALDILFSSVPSHFLIPSSKKQEPPTFDGSKISVQSSLQHLFNAISQARPFLKKAVASVPSESRQDFLSLLEWPDESSGKIQEEISSRRIKKKYEGMQNFSQESLFKAGTIILKSADQVIPALMKFDSHSPHRQQWKTPEGIFMVSGSGDDLYKEEDLDDVTVLIDLGGNNTYETPVAVAHENEIRVVIDFGKNVVIKSTGAIRGNAGSGIFGIGLLFLPNSEGQKRIETASYSQGCGIGGIGGLMIQGPSDLQADQYVQGMGAFGFGFLSLEKSSSSRLVATRMGQGFGMVRGVGIFRLEGNESDVKGGLIEPDPREPQGSLSMCQGVGYGHRAYAGGGVGIATVSGQRNCVTGSYFSQGVGYWHSFGVFKLRGDNNILQARRYDLGSGVHSAFGHFNLQGNTNRVLNWGVGPAYGWDHSIGSAFVEGTDNEIQVDWGAGVANIGSISLGVYKTNQSQLKLCGFGSGQFNRNEPSYSVQVWEGNNNRFQCLGEAPSFQQITQLPNLWGTINLEQGEFVKDLHLVPALWPMMPQEKTREREKVDLETRLKESDQKQPTEQVADLVDVAAAFALDKNTPKEARRRLVTLDEFKIPNLIDVLDPAAIDQLIQLSVVVPAHGDNAARAMITRLPLENKQKASLLINFLRLHRPSQVVPRLLEELNKEKPIVNRANLIRTLGQLCNKDTNWEPGLRAALLAVSASLPRPGNTQARKKAVGLLSRMTLAEGFGLLSTSTVDLKKKDKKKFLADGPEDITSPLSDKGAASYFKIISQQPKENLARIQSELRLLEETEQTLRTACLKFVVSTNTSETQACLQTLGQIAHPDDASLLGQYLVNSKSLLRETAAAALGRLGEPGLRVLENHFKTGDLQTRAVVISALQHTLSNKAQSLILEGLADPEPHVRLSTLALINAPPECLTSQRNNLIKEARKKLREEKDESVMLALKLLR